MRRETEWRHPYGRGPARPVAIAFHHVKRRRAPREPQQPAQPRPAVDERLAYRIKTFYGDEWLDRHGQALVWAMLLVEIPTQLLAYEDERREYAERVDSLEVSDPRAAELPRLRAMRDRPAVRCEVQRGSSGNDCVVALVAGSWPRGERIVQFAMCHEGQVHVRSVNTERKLGEIVTRARDLAEARKTAAYLARAAIASVTQ